MSKKDLVKIAASEIEAWITSGKYSNGDLLPSEGEISNILDISRPTARDAIRILEIRGFVDRIHGVGVKVNDRSIEVAIEFLTDMIQRNNVTFNELLVVRRLIEPKAAALAAVSPSVEDLENLKECVELMEKEKTITKKYELSDSRFHETLGRMCGNKLIHTIEQSYSSLLYKQIHEANLKEISIEAESHYHRKIYECIKNGDSEGAQRETLTHLDATAVNLNRLP